MCVCVCVCVCVCEFNVHVCLGVYIHVYKSKPSIHMYYGACSVSIVIVYDYYINFSIKLIGEFHIVSYAMHTQI